MSSRFIFRETWGQIRQHPGFWTMMFVAIFLSFVILQLAFSVLQRELQVEFLGAMTSNESSSLMSSYMLYFLLASLGTWLISTVARTLIIEGVFSFEEREENTFQDITRRTWSKIANVIGVDLILIGPFALIYWWFFLTLSRNIQTSFFSLQNGGDVAIAPPTSLALIPVLVCGTFIIIIPLIATTLFSSNAVVMETLGPIQAIKTGLRFLLDHLSSVVRLGLLLLCVLIVTSIAMGIISMPITFAAMLPMQQAMMECMSGSLENPENFEVINKCMLEAQQTPQIWFLHAIGALIGSFWNSIFALVLFISTSLLFYRLQHTNPAESDPQGTTI